MATRFTITNEGPGLLYIETVGQSRDFGRDTVLSVLRIPVGASMDAHVYPGHSFRVREAEQEQRGVAEIDYTVDRFALPPVSWRAVH